MGSGKKNKGGRSAKGTIDWVERKSGGGYYVAKITTVTGKRVREAMTFDDGRHRFTDKERDKVAARKYAQRMTPGVREVTEPKDATGAITVESFGLHWTSGALFKEQGRGNRLRVKKSARDDHNRLAKYIYPYIGKMPIAAVEYDDIKHAFRKADRAFEERHKRPMRAATYRHMYMVTHRLFELAVKPGDLRASNPVTEDLLPGKDAPLLYSYLYPQELTALLGCTDIPIARRVYYALATYTGLRKGSLKHFTWESIDFEHSTIVSFISKTDEYLGPQMFAQKDPEMPGLGTLIELLRRYRELLGWPHASKPIITNLHCRKDSEASKLREDLECAGVDRKHLFIKSPKVMPLRFHDLRATFVTWAFRKDKSEGWVTDRTGQLTKEILVRYKRAARSLADLSYEPFPDISNAIPELAGVNVTRLKSRKR